MTVEKSGESTRPIAFIMALLMSVFMTQNLVLDFRRDVDRMAYLESLPLSPFALALGQIVPAMLILIILQVIAFAVLALARGVPCPGRRRCCWCCCHSTGCR